MLRMKSIKRQAPRPPTSKVMPLTLSPTTNFSQRSTTRHCCCPNSDITTLLTELSNPNDELWMLMDQSYESEMNSLNSEQSDQTNDGILQSNHRMDQMNNRIEQTDDRSDQRNDKIDQTNDRRDQTNGRIDQTSNRIDQTNDRIDQTDNRIDQTNDRIDQTNDTSDQTVDRRDNAGETDVNDEIKDDTSSETTLIPQDISARRENHELIINSAKDRQVKEVSPKCNTSPSIINMKLKDNQKHDSDKNGQEREQDIRPRKIIRDLTPKFPRRPIVSKPDINMEDVVNKVNETYKKSNYLSIRPLGSRRFEETSSGSNDVNGNAKVGRTDGSLGLREVADDITPTEENLRREITFSDENPNSKIDVSARKLMDSSKGSHLTTMILDVPNEERSSNTLEDKFENFDSNEEKSSNTVDDNINKFLVENVETTVSNLTNTDELDPSRDETIPQETNGLENESTSIIPPPNEFANKTNLTRIESINEHYLRSESKSMGIILDDFEAQAVNGLHENVMNTFTNPLAQVTYYNHAQEFNQYLSTMLSEESTEETGIIANTGANCAPQSGIDKTRDSREVFRRNRETSSDVEFSSDSCASKDNALTQDEFDPYVDSSEVSSVNEFTLNDLNPNAFSFETHWKFVKPEHSDSIEVNLSDDSEMNSGYDSSSEESAEKSDEPESPIVKEKQDCNDEGVSNFLFRLNADIETFLNTDRKDGPSEVKSTTARSVTPACEPNSHHDVKKIEFKKQNKILPLVLQNSLTGSSYPANHPDFIDELKDNALEEEEELKDELGEMGSNISRHSGKGLSGRRTQSSGNLCNGKLVSNVGKLLVPCTKQGDDLTSPNRYKLCASLPNYLEKENLDELESCKFPYGINNNNNNNNELEFYDLKKDLELNLKPILIKSRTEDYVTNDQGYGSERSPEEEYPPDILNQKNLQDCGGEESSKASDQQICQVHPFINQNSSTFLVCIEKGSRGLGLSVMGGCDTEDHLIRIKRIFPHTPAAQCGVLSQGDVILTVNDVPLTGLTNYEALEVLRMTSHIVHLKVYRPPDVSQSQIPAPPSDPPPPPPKREPNSILVPVAPGDEEDKAREFDIVLTKNNGSLGFTLRKEDESVLGHYVRALVREPALSDGRIKPGDKILAVNGVEMSEMTHEDAVKFLRQCGDDVRLRLYRDATQTPVTALSPSRQHKQIKPILRKEAMDMLSDLAVKKLSPQPSTNSSRSSSPRCRKLKASSDQNNQNHDSRVLSPTRPDSLDFNNGEKKTRYQFSSPESDTGTPSSCSSNSSSIASQILPPLAPPPPPPLSDEPASLPPALPSSPPPLHHSQEPVSMPPLFSQEPKSPPYFLVKDTDDPYKASLDLSKSLDSTKSYPHPPIYVPKDEPDMYTSEHEPTSMPPMGSEHQGFQHGNPSYQSTIPVSSKKSETKLENGGASIPDLPAMLSPPPVEGSKGLLKWKGVVFSPDESEEHMDKIKPPLAFSVSSNGDEQIVVVELNRGWNSRLGFSLNEGPNASTVISAIHSDSVASRDGRLKVGDQIVMVNDESVETMSTPDIIDLLRKIRGSICIRVHRKNKAKTSVASNEL